ncbi:MAG: hypothetical protein PHU23_14655 [Dehalococcoidales bacterium]|nr:hypothetical protein [Dehalococcoidales bacterium]
MGQGNYAHIEIVQADAFHPNYDDVVVSLIIRNLADVPISVFGQITYTAGGESYAVDYNSPQYGTIDPGVSFLVLASFKMPDQDVVVNGYSSYYGSDGEWHNDGVYATTVHLENQNIIPSGYAYSRRILYPAAATYNGYYEIGTVKFNAPLTIFPGVTWIVDKLLGSFLSACLSNGGTPLEMRIFEKTGAVGSTDYIVQFLAYAGSGEVGHYTGGVGHRVAIAPLIMAAVLAAIGVILVGVIGRAVIGAIKSGTEYRYGPQAEVKTTTQPATKELNPGQSMAATGGTIIVTDKGGGDTSVTNSTGNTVKLSPGQSASVASGGTVVAGSQGATVNIPGGVTTTTGPSNPQGDDTVGNIVKYVAIAGGVLVLGLVAIAAFQSFGKREVYRIPMRT